MNIKFQKNGSSVLSISPSFLPFHSFFFGYGVLQDRPSLSPVFRTSSLGLGHPQKNSFFFTGLFFLLLLALSHLLAPTYASAGKIRAESAVLMDVGSGKILFEQHADTRIPPASLTKVLSLFVAQNAVGRSQAKLNQKVRVSRNAAFTPGSSLNLRPYDRVSLDKLFYGMAVASGNDASAAVAEHIAGSQNAFVSSMNGLARRIGMTRSHFVNVHGLPADGQYSTARDMARLGRAYYRSHPSAIRYHLMPSVTHNGHTEPNHNSLISCYPGILGLKTGWTVISGYHIIALARQNGRTLVAVVMNAPNSDVRAAEAARLLNAGFGSYAKRGTVHALLGISPKQARHLKESPAFSSNIKKGRGKKSASKVSKKRKKRNS